jgi:hypothetical protein
MYTLTLTKAERQAFDWVGDRYAAGAIATVLTDCLELDDEWDQDGDIAFRIPEHKAWEIRNLADEEDCIWPCFPDFLAQKMNTFLLEIV